MKLNRYLCLFSLLGILTFVKGQYAELDTYENAQAFIDKMYSQTIDYNKHSITTAGMFADFGVAVQSWASANKDVNGSYQLFIPSLQSNFYCSQDNTETNHDESGIWPDGWRGIAFANLVLSKVENMSGSQQEKDYIAGQAYFFRGFQYWELARHWGGLPYITSVYHPDSNFYHQRPGAQETLLKAAADLQKAAILLPETWGVDTFPGKAKATKGAAMGIRAKALLFAASPLYNLDAGNNAEYNTTILQQAAEAAKAVIDLDVYSLIDFTNYKDNFCKNDGTYPWTEETIWGKYDDIMGSGNQIFRHGRIFTPLRYGGNLICITPTQNLVDLFEMLDGSLYKTGLSASGGYDDIDSLRWEKRDPRFRAGIYVDGDNPGYAAEAVLVLNNGDRSDADPGSVLSPYICHKFWPKGANTYDKIWNHYTYATPHLRYAEILLIYAEAVNELYGPTGSINGGLTALEAVNMVRARAGMPNVLSEFTGTKEAFSERIRNERAVELFFEGHRWHDLRRWYIAENEEFTALYKMDFPQDYSYFYREKITDRIFNKRHYWLPMPVAENMSLYFGFFQNFGW